MKTEDQFDKIEIPAGLEARLDQLIDRLEEKEKQAKNKIRQIRWGISGMAASVALLLSIGIILNSNDTQRTVQEEISLPEQESACMEAQKALALVSLKFNKGMDQLTLAVNEIEKSNNTIYKTFKR